MTGYPQHSGHFRLSGFDNVADFRQSGSSAFVRHFPCVLILALALSTTGCSYEYEIRAELIDGKLAFVTKNTWFDSPTCVRAVTVDTDDGPKAKAEPGDHLASIKRGVYWEEWLALDSCENKFPLIYGTNLTGPKFHFHDGTSHSVKPKTLIRGVVYKYFTLSDGSGGGGGSFRISEDGKVINLRR